MSHVSGFKRVNSSAQDRSWPRAVGFACLLLAACAASASAAPFTYYFGDFAINEGDPEAGRRKRASFDADAGAAISGSPRAEAIDTFLDATYAVWATPAASASSTMLKAESWIGYDLGLGWASVRARARAGAEFSDTLDLLWGSVVPNAGYALEFDWSVDGTYEARLSSADGGYGVLEFSDMRYQYISSADLFVNWTLAGDPVGNSENVFAGDLHRTDWEHTDPFMRSGLEFLPLGGNANRRLTGVEDLATAAQPRISRTVSIPVGTSPSVDLVFMLQTAGNLGLYNVDFSGGLNGNLVSLFSNTAELTAVRLVDGNGTPVTGDWSIQSRSGASYPIERGPGQVPEPTLLSVLGLGLVTMGARAMRRQSAASRR